MIFHSYVNVYQRLLLGNTPFWECPKCRATEKNNTPSLRPAAQGRWDMTNISMSRRHLKIMCQAEFSHSMPQ